MNVMPKFTLTYGEDLFINNPNEVSKRLGEETEPTAEDIERMKRIEKMDLNVLNRNYSVIKDTVSYIPIDDIIDPPEDWVIFNRMKEEEFYELKHSIMNYGLFTPLIVWERANGQFMILSGLERWEACLMLRNEAMGSYKDKYEKLPCFVIEQREINNVMARVIRIDSNICIRNMDVRSKNKALVMKYKALQFFKKTRNELNVLDELARSFKLSRSQVTNHLATLRVTEEFLYLFQEGKLSLKSIKKLSKFSKEEQKKLYEGLGELEIKECQIATLSEEGINDPKRLEQSVNILKDMKVPYFSSIKIKLPTKHLEDAYVLLVKFIERNPGLYMKMRKMKFS